MDIYLFLFLIFFAAPVGIAVHEMGHMLGAKMVNADKTTLTIGTGNVIFRRAWKQTEITIRMLFFLGGAAGSQRKIPYELAEQIKITALGPLSNFLAAGFCYGLYIAYPGDYLLIVLLFNLWVGLINIIPYRMKGKESDGYTIRKIIKKK